MLKRTLSLVLAILLTLTVVACGKDEKVTDANPVETKEETTTDKQDESAVEELVLEAPMLTALVDEGKLPPLEERLPAQDSIMIESVLNEVGQFGGELKMPWRGLKDKWRMEKFTEEALFRFKNDGSGGVEPNVAKGFEVNEDSTEFTIYLREGMKWSDGEPFTADDVVFYYYDMVLQEVSGKAPKACYYSVNPETGERVLADVEKVDDYSFKVKFAHPSVMFLERLAIDDKWMYAPKHYYEKMLPHIIGEEEAMKIAKDMGYEDMKSYKKWTAYYYWVLPGRPTLRPWVAANDPNEEVFVMERNPFYFKTDEDGRQLPYVDKLVMPRVENDSHFELEGIAGNIDLHVFNVGSFTLLKENEQAGDYHVEIYESAEWSSSTIQLNQTVKDDNLRELFQDIRFREAISLAIDRQEIANLAHNGLVDPYQASVAKGLANYQDGWSKQWIEFNPDRSKELLDEIGLPVDKDGNRTFKDGSEFNFILYAESKGDEVGKAEELMEFYLNKIGIQTTVKLVDRGYLEEMIQSNDMTARSGNVQLFNVALRPDEIVPLRNLKTWAGHYGINYASHGEKGVKPEGDVALLVENWDKLASATTKDEVHMYAENIVKLHQKNQWVIGYTSPMPKPILVKNYVKNVPTEMLYCDEFRDMGYARPAQFFIKK